MKAEKIWIFGGIGSGKTIFAEKLSKKIGIPFYTTDNMIYLNNFKKKYTIEKRNFKLKEISKKRSWIFEGVHKSDWILPAFDKSELVIFIDTRMFKRMYRTLMREFCKKETKIRNILQVLYYSFIYTFDNRRHHCKMVEKRNKETLFLKNNKEINKFLENLE